MRVEDRGRSEVGAGGGPNSRYPEQIMCFRVEAHGLGAKLGLHGVEDAKLVWGVFVENVHDAARVETNTMPVSGS